MTNERPLRIVRFITWLPIGGIERRIATILPQLKDRGHHVEIVCLRELGALTEEIRARSIPVTLLPLKSRLDPAGIKTVVDFIRKGSFDVIHSHMYRSNVPVTIAARLAGFTGVVLSQVHNINTWETRRQIWMDRFLCRWRDGVVSVSEAVRHDIIDRLKIPPDKCFVIYNGIDIEYYRNIKKDPGAREELGLSPGDIIVIMVARLVKQKNHSMVIKAARDIIASMPNIKFLFVGEGCLRKELERDVHSAGLSSNIIFTGQRDDIPRLLAISDIAILPSLKEGFSNAIIEAMAVGLPVIASNAGGNAEAIENGVSGIIIQPDDKEAFTEAVIKLSTDESLRKPMAIESYRRAEKFSIREMVLQTERLYYSLQDRKKSKL